jgi:unsaturated pyranuronate lyase
MQLFFSGKVEAKPVTLIEGTPTSGTFFVKPLLNGHRIAMLEVRMAQGVSSQMHMHTHESLLYVISGSLKTVIADQVLVVRQGEACRQPENVMHSVEALEDTLFVEVKAPVPELQATLGISDGPVAA